MHANAAQWEFHLLGPLEIVRAGTSIKLNAPKIRTMLAMLIAHANGLVSLESLVDEVWGMRPPRSAVANIRTYASQLRRQLPGRLASQGDTYRFTVLPGELDLHAFSELVDNGRSSLRAGRTADGADNFARAFGLWRGRPFEIVPISSALSALRSAYEQERQSALEMYYSARLMMGEHDSIVSPLFQLVATNPLRERAQALLMLALYRAGDPGAALTAYRQACRCIAGELGIDAGAELGELHRAILRRDDTVLWAGAPLVSGPSVGNLGATR
jgi:DNA-binding SARP family transcriptional activator